MTTHKEPQGWGEEIVKWKFKLLTAWRTENHEAMSGGGEGIAEKWSRQVEKEFEEWLSTAYALGREEERADYIKGVLLDFHKNTMEGKGYDFFFKLSTDLEDLLSITNTKDKEV